MTDRELDELVTEHVTDGEGAPLHLHGNYPDDIAAAWCVVEKMEHDGESFHLIGARFGDAFVAYFGLNPEHIARKFWERDGVHIDDTADQLRNEGHSLAVESLKRAPRAICLAALKARGVEVPA